MERDRQRIGYLVGLDFLFIEDSLSNPRIPGKYYNR